MSLWEIASGRERAHFGTPPAAPGVGQPAAQAFVIVNGNVRGAAFPTTPLAFTPDGTLLAARGPNNAVRVWEVAYLKEIGSLKGHEGAVQTVAFAADGHALASGSSDTTVLVWDITKLKREPKTPAVALQSKELDALWSDLSGDDAAKASRSIQALAVAGNQTVTFLRERLKPAAPVDEKKLAQWILDLSSSNFATRTKATHELEKLSDLAVPALKKVLASQAPLETIRRVEPLLEKLTTGDLTAEQLRTVRSMEVLEKLNTSEGRQLLETLAKGAPGALMTRQARGVLDYLAKTAAR